MDCGFDSAFTELLGNEGGYSDDPSDPGGATRWGITQRVARRHGYQGDMRDLPQSVAREIARSEYWDPYRCDEMPAPIGFQVFDAAYNGGHPAQWLQQAVGTTVDGEIGPQTVAAANAANAEKTILRFDAYRLEYLASLQIWPDFGRGWARRIASNMLLGAAK